MSDSRRVLLLILIMVTVALMVGGISIILLYRTALQEEETRLIETAQSQARLIEAVARFDATYSQGYSEGPMVATLSQIRDAHAHYTGFGETGEFTLAKREGDRMVFLLSHRHYDLELPKPVPFDSDLAEPMRRSLSGQSGTVVGLDYRGEMVLAAYEPVAELNWGIVAKIDLVEIRSPFVTAGLTAVFSGLLVITMGSVLFIRMTNPLLRQLAESEERFRNIIECLPMGLHMYQSETDGQLRFMGANPAADQILGVDNTQYIGQTIHEAFPQMGETEVPERFQTIAEKGGVWHKEDIVYKDKRIRRAVEYSNFQTSPGKMVSLFTDSTERKQAEEALLREYQYREAESAIRLQTALMEDPRDLHKVVKAVDEQLRVLGVVFDSLTLQVINADSNAMKIRVC